MKNMIIELSKLVGQGGAFRREGEKIRDYFETEWNHIEHFCISFKGLKGASPSFLDEAFAKLFLTHDQDEVLSKLKFTGIEDYHRQNLNSLIAIRLRQKARQKAVESGKQQASQKVSVGEQ